MVRRFFAPGTATSSAAGRRAGPEVCRSDIDEIAATLGCPSLAAAGVTVEVAAAAPADVVETEASTRPGTAAGPDVEPDAQPAKRGRRRVGRQVHIRVARANPFTPPPPGPVATRR